MKVCDWMLNLVLFDLKIHICICKSNHFNSFYSYKLKTLFRYLTLAFLVVLWTAMIVLCTWAGADAGLRAP